MHIQNTPFRIDTDNADYKSLAVDVEGLGTVYITADDSKGELRVDLFPLHVVDEPLASCSASYDDLMNDPEEDEEEDEEPPSQDEIEDCTALNMLLGHSPEDAAKAARGDPDFWGRRNKNGAG